MEEGLCKLFGRRIYVPPGQIISYVTLKVLCLMMKIAVMSILKHKGYNVHHSFLSVKLNNDVRFHVVERETKPNYLCHLTPR